MLKFILLSLICLFHSKVFAFKQDFKWCVATAAHQIEGNNIHSDWWKWEKLPEKIKNSDRSGLACDHLNRVDRDIQLMTNLGIDTYRFSISWSRIQPKENSFNEDAIIHYKREINRLLQNGITPIITLHHFVSPQWFTQSGGWARANSVDLFMAFVHKIYSEFGQKISWWTTINEPMVFLAGGYIDGVIPPGKKGFNFKQPLLNLLKAHAKVYEFLHKKAKEEKRIIHVGLAHHIRFLEAYRSWNPIDIVVAKIANYIFNYLLPESLATGRLKLWIPFILDIDEEIPGLKNSQDYIGLNYYTRELLEVSILDGKVNRKFHTDKILSDLNWEHYPQGMDIIVRDYAKLFPQIPFLITENGIADAEDKYRTKFIDDHLQQMEILEKEGFEFLGYCYWSLMDNFEWIEGFEPRFGLYHTNYTTQERTLRKSGQHFSKIIQAHKNR